MLRYSTFISFLWTKTPHILFITLFACTACEDLVKPKEPELPPITTEGKNTFGCLVNGEVWLPKGGVNSTDLNFFLTNISTFNLQAFRDNQRESIQLYLIDCCKEDSLMSFNRYPANSATYSKNGCFIETDSLSGIINILKFDRSKFIIAGTFEFTVWNDECDTIKVTDGQFDIKYR